MKKPYELVPGDELEYDPVEGAFGGQHTETFVVARVVIDNDTTVDVHTKRGMMLTFGRNKDLKLKGE